MTTALSSVIVIVVWISVSKTPLDAKKRYVSGQNKKACMWRCIEAQGGELAALSFLQSRVDCCVCDVVAGRDKSRMCREIAELRSAWCVVVGYSPVKIRPIEVDLPDGQYCTVSLM
jgi:hypothetical protein